MPILKKVKKREYKKSLKELEALIRERLPERNLILDMPLLNTMKYKDLNGIESLISDLILQLLSYMAEDERKRIGERQEEGIRVATQNGVKIGRKKIEINETFQSAYQDWKQKRITAVEAMKKIGMKSNTFYRRVKEYETNL